MKTLIYSSIILSLLAAACSTPKLSGYADKTDLTTKVKYDFNRRKIRDNGKGFCVDMTALGKLPKRVALVSFYIDDPGITKVSGSNATGKSYRTSNTGSDKGKEFANEFAADGIETIKATFKTYGMEVLTPNEFLTDETTKQAYANFTVKHTSMNELGQKIMKWMKNSGNAGTTIEMDECADGYRLVKVNKRDFGDPKKKAVSPQNLNGTLDGQLIESVGYELAKALNVDAVLIVFNSQLADVKGSRTRYWLGAVNMQLLGPNPTPLKEGKKDNNSYSKGLFYCGVRLSFKKGLAINPKIKDDALKAENDKQNDVAYKNMITGCSNKIGMYLQKELAGK